MKQTVMVLASLSLMVLALGADQPKKSTRPAPAGKTPAKQPARVSATGLPSGAKEIAPNTYRWVDAKGQAWIYRQTPFGYMKGPETAPEPETIPADWRVAEEGELLRFERPSPFGGVQRWTKKKDELDPVESAVWKRSQKAGEANKDR